MTLSTFPVIALDLGTTSVKAGLLDHAGALGHMVARPAPEVTAHGGRYESDALAYVAVADQVLEECLVQADDCKILGLCSQRSSFLVWVKATGQPLTALISWQDNRGKASCEAMHAHEQTIRTLTGLPLTPYYIAPKLRVLLLENPDWLARLSCGELMLGTLDTFLVWRWTGGKYHVTDASMAARTLLMDIRLRQWSTTLCNLFGIPLHILPQIRPSAEINLLLENGLTLTASVGDQSAALFASVKDDGREALVNLGTGCFVARYLTESHSETEQAAPSGYLSTLVYQHKNRIFHFATEGTLNSTASALAPYPVVECSVSDLASNDIFCLAEPSGLGAPYFVNSRFVTCVPDPLHDDLGIQFSKSVEHLSQRQISALLLEAIIFRVAKILEDFHRQSTLEGVYLSGGLSELKCLQHGIASCVPFDVYRLRQSESSLQGVALLASGMESASYRVGDKIPKARDNSALLFKYHRWKSWLDALLGFSAKTQLE